MPISATRCLTHQALLYDSLAGLVSGVLPLVHDGLRLGEEVVVVTSGAATAAIRDGLPAGQAGRVTFESAGEHYQQAAQALTAYQHMLDEYARAGTRVRIVAEQPLADLPAWQVDELCRIDAAFNEVSCADGATVVCAYDRRQAAPHVTGMVLRSHPEVLEGGARRRSTSYTEPQTLLALQDRGPPLDAPPPDAAALPCPQDIADARAFVGMVASFHGLADPALGRFVTAVNEIVSNATIHAVLDTVLVWREDDRVVCEVRDYGFGLTDHLAGYRLPERSWTSGRGLWLARQLTDLVEVRTGLDGSTFRLHALAGTVEPGT